MLSGAISYVISKMIVTVVKAELPPIPWSTGAGLDLVQRRARPMIKEMASSAILMRAGIPTIHATLNGYRLPQMVWTTARVHSCA